ncbi:MAG: trypsin-like peptidase domain-containing protein [Clostridia bacterium]
MKKSIFLAVALIIFPLFFSGCSISNIAIFKPFINQSQYSSAYSISATITGQDTDAQVAQKLLPACVTVKVMPLNSSSGNFGSGVAIAEHGYIVTNFHVIKDSIGNQNYKISVFNNGDILKEIPAIVVWHKEQIDVAILKINEELPFVNMLDRAIHPQKGNELVYDKVIAIGTPVHEYFQNTVKFGRVSKLNCYDVSGIAIYENLIMHDANINPGNSGGGLFDVKGNLIGLNTLGYEQSAGLFFAVPIFPVITMLPKVIANFSTHYQPAVLGVSGFDGICSFLANQKTGISLYDPGFLITEITEKKGSVGILQVGDIILKLELANGTTREINNRDDLCYALLESVVGDNVNVTINRKGNKEIKSITLTD